LAFSSIFAAATGQDQRCASALARLERAGQLDRSGAARAFDRLKQLADGWHEIEPSEVVRENAVRLLRVHQLRAADALQLAAAFLAAERRPSSLEVVTLDDRLADALRSSGHGLSKLGPEPAGWSKPRSCRSVAPAAIMAAPGDRWA
jgi:predicted nucleic acid-binding protein